ncbi:MAG: hypothetical protein KGH71_06155, partial [Candidatus Micrarchaeota archaeon]|nr:hypothetical protein [Candidatus Micrarchaeota archaeon]
FGQGGIAGSFPWLGPNFDSYGFVLQVALLIVAMVFAALAIMYAVGYGFGIPRILVFVKTEYLESVLNIIMIVVLFGGAAVLSGGMVFISNLGNAVIASAGAAGSAPLVALGANPTAGYQDIQGIYSSVCQTYMSDAVSHLAGLSGLNGISYGYSIASGFVINLMPNGMGISIAPLAGITPYLLLVGFLSPLVSGVVGIEIGVVFFMVIVYYLFPLLLFAGVLMRSFQWTRAAGGTLIALFIGFYIFFPALIYPFTTVNYHCLEQADCSGQYILGSSSIGSAATAQDPFTQLQTLAGEVAQAAVQSEFVDIFDFYIFSIINASFQIFGIIISFVIS